jgi:2-amino-4-hydroxy-6-hydroxymethyldihydropteridine diphosphokinase
MPIAYISIGSNINPAENVIQSLHLLRQQVRILNISTVYFTEAIDRPEQPKYYNGVIAIETQPSPLDLKYTILRPIEMKLGRERTTDKSVARPIDLDILLFEDQVISNPELTIPDPQILNRAYIAIPLYEIAPNLLIPKYNILIKDIAVTMYTVPMQPLEEYTQMLRKEFLSNA